MKKQSLLFVLFFSFLTMHCSTDDNGKNSPNNNGQEQVDDDDSNDEDEDENKAFSREDMMLFFADDFIIPAYQNFKTKASNLNEAIETFTNEPTNESLEALRVKLKAAYLAYQAVGFFEFGKAYERYFFQYRVNNFPVNTTDIIRHAKEHNYNFMSDEHLYGGHIAQGLPAIDYLINGLSRTNTGILFKYTRDAHAEDYKAYVKKVSEEIVNVSNDVINDWLTEYRDKFINDLTDYSTGSTSLLVGAYVNYYRSVLRDKKIGKPTGIENPLNINETGSIRPHLVESYYSPQNSQAYALENLQQMANFFNGISFNQSKQGNSLYQYLNFLDAKQGNTGIADDIARIFNESKEQIAATDPNFVLQIQTDIEPMKAAFQSLQNNIINLKVTMPQMLNITISNVDGDGD